VLKAMVSTLFLLLSLVALSAALDSSSLKSMSRRLCKGIVGFGLVAGVPVVQAKEPLPSLERCFAAVKRELDPNEGESLTRLKKDIETGEWADIKLFTREYDAGFRGGVLKKSWKQLGDKKADGIRISNSFTFDLIGLNQAARKEDKDEAMRMLDAVRSDIVEFSKLE
jgi:hypothetical protein